MNINLFKEFFKGRTEIFVEQQNDGGYLPVQEKLKDGNISNHLAGKNSYGIYLIEPTCNMCWHTVIDIDTKEVDVLKKIKKATLELGLEQNQILTEFSGNKGYHLWLNFNEAIEAEKARKLGKLIVVSSRVGGDIEVFPKQDRVRDGGYGNPIKLPLGIHKLSGNSSYLLNEQLQKVDDWESCLINIQKISPGQANNILDKFIDNVSSVSPCNYEKSKTAGSEGLPCFKRIMQNGVSEGKRDDVAFRLAIYLKNHGVVRDLALSSLITWNKKNNPPLDNRIIENKINSAFDSGNTSYGCEKEFMKEFCNESCHLRKKQLSSAKVFPVPADYTAFRSIQFPERESYFGNGIIDPKSKIIISGPAKLGKTIFALNIALSLATGKSFLNIPVRRKVRVLYLQAEVNEARIQERLRYMEQHTDIPENGYFVCHTIKGFKVLNEIHFSQLESWLEKGNFDVVFFDPLTRFHNQEENSAKEMNVVLDRFDELIEKFSVSVVAVHHHRKTRDYEKHGTQQVRGSTVIVDWGDSYITLNKHKDVFELKWELRNVENPDDLLLVRDGLWYEVTTSKGRKKHQVSDLLDLMKSFDAECIAQKDIVKKAYADKKIKSGTVRNLIKEAEKEKKIEFKPTRGSGKLWRIKY